MKKARLIILILIAAALGIVISVSSNVEKYTDFTVAEDMAAEGNTSEVHIVGRLKKDSLGNILGMYYNPSEQGDYFRFVLVDDSLREETIHYYDAKPADIEKSEKVVVMGGFREGKFVADKILLKCPSKYEERGIKRE